MAKKPVVLPPFFIYLCGTRPDTHLEYGFRRELFVDAEIGLFEFTNGVAHREAVINPARAYEESEGDERAVLDLIADLYMVPGVVHSPMYFTRNSIVLKHDYSFQPCEMDVKIIEVIARHAGLKLEQLRLLAVGEDGELDFNILTFARYVHFAQINGTSVRLGERTAEEALQYLVEYDLTHRWN